MLGDAEAAAGYARIGLVRAPKDNWLLNNLAVSLARQGKISEAADTIEKVSIDEKDYPARIVNVATRGLILFRAGQPDVGRKFYEHAIKAATSLRLTQLAIRAQLNLFYEEVHHDPFRAKEFLERITKLPGRDKAPEAENITERVRVLATVGEKGAAPTVEAVPPTTSIDASGLTKRLDSPWARIEIAESD